MLVLWLVIILGVIATGVVSAARAHMSYVGTSRSRTVARYAAESGVVEAAALLKEFMRSATTPEEQVRAFRALEEELASGGPRELAAARYQVVIADLNARVDLNNSSEEVILGLFEHFFGGREGNGLLQALQDWVDEDGDALPQGAEGADYARVGSLFRPPNRPMRRLDELSRVLGFTDSIADILAPYVTVRGDGRLNVNSAPLPVLAAAPELGPSGADMLIASRERGDVLASRIAVSSLLAEARGGVGGQLSNLTTMPGHIVIVSRGWQEGQPLTHEIQAVYQLFGLNLDDGPRFRLRYWTGRDL
jgi:general secretion pathway protein K